MAAIADENLLKSVWKKQIRMSLRALKFDNFNLAPDPIHYAAYEWGLEALIAALARDLRLGRYSPERGEIVRTAKGNGLSRPLIFLAARDALVYKTITWLIEGELVASSPAWVGYSHRDKGSTPAGDRVDRGRKSFDWFQFWLAKEGSIAQMMDDPDVEFFVESDIANFYPSIRLEAIREHLHSNTTLDKEVVRLCVQIIDGVMPRQDYSEVSLMGLPQEQIGSSRAISHSLLQHVDEEFETEGRSGRYTRFMDDILVGVKSEEVGARCIARLQLRLESLGLYPNASKTRIVPVKQHFLDSMVAENATIERLTEQLEKHDSGGIPHVAAAPQELLDEISQLALAHREMANRPRRWGQVMRRLYTLQRRAGLDDWWKYWLSDLQADPGSAASILEYVRSWPLTVDTVDGLVSLSVKYCQLYPDVSILAAEAIATAPNANDVEFWTALFRAAKQEFERIVRIKPQAPDLERIAAAWLVAAWKFANDAQSRRLMQLIPDVSDSLSPVRAQALPLLASAGESLSEWVAAKPGLAWENALAAEYLRSLIGGEDRAAGVALDLVKPRLRLAPQRFLLLPRSLPLMEILGRHASAKFSLAAPRNLSDLQKNPDRLRDRRTEAIVGRWCP